MPAYRKALMGCFKIAQSLPYTQQTPIQKTGKHRLGSPFLPTNTADSNSVKKIPTARPPTPFTKPPYPLLKPALAISLLAVLTWFITAGHADELRSYKVELSQTNNEHLDQILTDSANLIGLQETAPVGSFALVARAREDVERLTTALHSQGYYQAQVTITIAGRTLHDPGIFDTIDYAPPEPPVPVHIGIEPGPLFTLGQITLTGTAPASAQSWLGLTPGTPAQAAGVLAARDTLLNRLHEAGYALAKVDEPLATLVVDNQTVDIAFHVEAGQKVHFGTVSVTGLQRVKPDFAQDQVQLPPGKLYSATAIERARQDLLNTGVFSSVRSKIATELDQQGRLPVEFVVAERPLRATSIGAAFSTDIGGSVSTFWQHRNLLGEAEQLRLTAGVTQIGGNSTTGIGYNLAVAFNKPHFLQRNQSFEAGILALRQNFFAYKQESIIAQLGLLRRFDSHWSGGANLALEQATVAQEHTVRDYTLLSLPLTARYSSINNLLDPTEGMLAVFSITPFQPLAGSGLGNAFAIIQASGSTYLDLGKPGRSVLAVRGLLGHIEGADPFGLPPDKRFYAGGSATVRGYRFQAIGPQFPSGRPQGGTAIATGTVEWRQRILADYGFAAFVDGGQVSSDSLAEPGTWGVGTGIGARYYTPFGPIRVDVAVPVLEPANLGAFEIYIGLGQAF